jgi:hypothetical protein
MFVGFEVIALRGSESIALRSTVKALANFSPGLSSGNPGKEISFVLHATLKELRLRGLSKPRVSKQTLG